LNSVLQKRKCERSRAIHIFNARTHKKVVQLEEQINYRPEDNLLVMSLYLLRTTGKKIVRKTCTCTVFCSTALSKQNNHNLDQFEYNNSISTLLIITRALLFSHLQHYLNRIRTIDTLCFLSQ